MAYLRVSEPGVGDVVLADLGYTVPQSTSNFLICDQFTVEELQNSMDLIAAVQGGLLTAQVNLDGTWTNVTAGDFNGEDVYAAYANIYEIVNTVDNQRLVNGSDCSTTTQLHHHDARYFTEAELSGTGGADLIGVDNTLWTNLSGSTVQEVFDYIDSYIVTVDLDIVYDNDSDGIMHVDGSIGYGQKNLNLLSNNVNDIIISRTNLTNSQNALLFDVSANELILGSPAVGALAEVDVHILSDLYIDGNITFTGTITDTTVNELNVTNANITLREGAVTDANATFEVNRPIGGTNASILWDENVDRWKAGLLGSENTIALLEVDEVVTGVWEFQGGAATEPNMYLTNKTSAPSTNLGTSTQYPMSLINGQLAVYDKSNSRNKFLSVARYLAVFAGRDHNANKNEYLRTGGAFTSNNTGFRVAQACTLVSITLESSNASAWTAKVQKNYNGAVDIYTKATGGAKGVQDITLNVDLAAGDTIQVYLSSAGNIERPNVVLEYAYRY